MSNRIELRIHESLFNRARLYAASRGYRNIQELLLALVRNAVAEPLDEPTPPETPTLESLFDTQELEDVFISAGAEIKNYPRSATSRLHAALRLEALSAKLGASVTIEQCEEYLRARWIEER